MANVANLPSVGDKNAFTGICTVSEYFPSSYDFDSCKLRNVLNFDPIENKIS